MRIGGILRAVYEGIPSNQSHELQTDSLEYSDWLAEENAYSPEVPSISRTRNITATDMGPGHQAIGIMSEEG